MKGAFIEVASHELNTPLTVVLGMIDLWKMSQGQTASPVERQWVDRIGAAAGRLARTVERMLKLVRNREFSQSLDTELVELGPGRQSRASRSFSLPRAATADGDRRHRSRAGPDRGRPVQDRRRPDQPAGQRGQVHARRRHDPSRSPYRARLPGLDPRRRSATRVGVAADDQQHLFEPFFTGFDTLRHSSGEYQYGKRGIGLGLAWSRRSSSSTAAASKSRARPAWARLSPSYCRDRRADESGSAVEVGIRLRCSTVTGCSSAWRRWQRRQ